MDDDKYQRLSRIHDELLQLRFYHCTTLVPVDWPGEIVDSACFAK